ncbi:GspH/FimT family pseudopilin [Stutzerimonas zhaodongensis]|uniref:GspH/FimT family pseudopilin n=1 Tax=Stutzerimonas zhaodongensis TaxID=1176257 RepID=UPI0021062FB0|nr:GspH/FimT family pseudopilin [Stutzerimonas zhaodongensis]MCQ2031038.1 GspH/FimT family pseudopilin [Stutzerimonas zhaodongensis]
MADKDQGFTLVEVLIVIALLAIVVAVAVPALDDFIARNRQQTLMEQIETAMNNARADAVLRRRTIEICGSSNGQTCSGSWHTGLLVHSSSDNQLMSFTQLTSPSDIRWDGFGKSVRFYDNGSSPTSNGRIYLCHEQKVAWQLVLSRQGRLRRGSTIENRTSNKCGS